MLQQPTDRRRQIVDMGKEKLDIAAGTEGLAHTADDQDADVAVSLNNQGQLL
ncbi:hypothetical protein D3C78_1030660 [compost metagenome]